MNAKLRACLFFCGLFAAAHAAEEPSEYAKGVRFDLHQREGGVQLVGRAQPGTSPETLARALNARALQICPGAIVSKQQAGTYWHAKGGNQYLMPAGGILIPMNVPNSIESAPMLSAWVGCSNPTTSTAAPVRLRLAVVPRLGNVISYIDQGFASSNRAKLDVPVTGPSFDEVASTALIDALRERGYDVELAPSTDETATRIEIAPASNPGESFNGLALMTKIGLLGIDKASYAFCSFRITLLKARMPPKPLQQFNTRDRIAPIYADWDKDMKNGPSTDIHRAVYVRLASTLDHDIKAAIHVLPATTLESLAPLPAALREKAGGYQQWQFGMTPEQVKAVGDPGRYYVFKNGDVGAGPEPFEDGQALLSFYFKEGRMERAMLIVYDGEDPGLARQAWAKAHAHLSRVCGEVESPSLGRIPTTPAMALSAYDKDVPGLRPGERHQMGCLHMPAGEQVWASATRVKGQQVMVTVDYGMPWPGAAR